MGGSTQMIDEQINLPAYPDVWRMACNDQFISHLVEYGQSKMNSLSHSAVAVLKVNALGQVS